MTMLVGPAHSRQLRRARAVYGSMRTVRNARTDRTDRTDSLLAELAMLAAFLLLGAGVIALRAWLHVPAL